MALDQGAGNQKRADIHDNAGRHPLSRERQCVCQSLGYQRHDADMMRLISDFADSGSSALYTVSRRPGIRSGYPPPPATRERFKLISTFFLSFSAGVAPLGLLQVAEEFEADGMTREEFCARIGTWLMEIGIRGSVGVD